MWWGSSLSDSEARVDIEIRDAWVVILSVLDKAKLELRLRPELWTLDSEDDRRVDRPLWSDTEKVL